ncbi:MAG: ACT domain-containing protein [Candidatus Omnitrophica bacterium]|nr:ACT domain-containing protein [Candidatus Omnitrophota bacterium]
MRITKQLSIFLENRLSGLAKICAVLSEAEINITALTIHDTVDHAIVRLIPDKHIKALLLLEQEGMHIVEQDVVVMDLDNKPGALASVVEKLARADISIDYAYCTASERQSFGCIVLKTSNIHQALELLRRDILGENFN